MQRYLFIIPLSCWLFIASCDLAGFTYVIARTDGKPDEFIKISLNAQILFLQGHTVVNVTSVIRNSTEDTISIPDNVIDFESPGLIQTKKRISFSNSNDSIFYQRVCRIIPGDSMKIISEFQVSDTTSKGYKRFLKHIKNCTFKASVSGIHFKDQVLPKQEYSLTAPADI